MLDALMAQAASAVSFENLLQLGGMSGVASVLLYAVLRKAKEQDRAFRSLSITLITIQQSLLIYAMSHRLSKSTENEVEECKRILAACDELKRILENQRVELEKQSTEK